MPFQTTSTSSTNKNLQVVVGLGLSGLSAVQYLNQHGYEVAITDGHTHPKLSEQLPKSVTNRHFGEINIELLLSASRIIISPGISLEQPAIAQAIKSGIPVVSDIQIFHEELSKKNAQDTDKKPTKIIAITGSNAKSTVTTLVGEMANDAGVNVGVGGNIGLPALQLLDNHDMNLAVLELSSFQLETVTSLNADIVTVLNLSPDHLDRHGNMDKYKQAKHRIFQGAKSIVINRDDDMTIPEQSFSNTISIGSDKPTEGNFGLITDNEGYVYLAKGQDKLLCTNELKIKGQHNQLNALHALALGELADLPMASMLKTLKKFGGLPHRCQYIRELNGVDYFNDSKGTNIGSTMAAIKGLGESYTSIDKSAKLAIILGGQSKGQNFSEMTDLINQFVEQIYFIGADAKLIEQQLISEGLNNNISCKQMNTIDNAFADSKNIYQRNNNIKAVLLSPACASFDQFSSYIKRGEHFIQLLSEI